MDPQWRESVLSTRSLSYISHAGSTPGAASRQGSMSYFRAPTARRNSTHSDMSIDEPVEMAVPKKEQQGLNDIPELPESVARSLLFELPREIRDRIYALCLTSNDGTPVEWPRPRDAIGRYGLQPQLLRTCKIIHDESAPLLYTLNNLTFHHPSDANMFVHAFASSPMYGRQITHLSLHIKSQDMRMWMSYLTSTDESRSLKADFPNLKDLGVRFRSTKWQHQHPPEANLKNWCEDNRLEELVDGLRHVFITGPVLKDRLHDSEREVQAYLSRNPNPRPDDAEMQRLYQKQLFEIEKSRSIQRHHDMPVIKVCCACRVHSTHFNAITNPARRPAEENAPEPAQPVVEGEKFRGFTAVDLQRGVMRLTDPDLGSANVARTPYADKDGIQIALEIHCLDPKRDAGERAS